MHTHTHARTQINKKIPFVGQRLVSIKTLTRLTAVVAHIIRNAIGARANGFLLLLREVAASETFATDHHGDCLRSTNGTLLCLVETPRVKI